MTTEAQFCLVTMCSDLFEIKWGSPCLSNSSSLHYAENNYLLCGSKNISTNEYETKKHKQTNANMLISRALQRPLDVEVLKVKKVVHRAEL